MTINFTFYKPQGTWIVFASAGTLLLALSPCAGIHSEFSFSQFLTCLCKLVVLSQQHIAHLSSVFHSHHFIYILPGILANNHVMFHVCSCIQSVTCPGCTPLSAHGSWDWLQHPHSSDKDSRRYFDTY